MKISAQKNHYGWIKQLPDQRDFLFAPEPMLTLPSVVDLRPQCPPVVDQGQLGSCTANSIANGHYFEQLKQKEKSSFMPSRLFIYYNERAMEGTIKSDAGADIRDGFKSIGNQGVCPETEWPYVISTFKTKPSAKCFKDALVHEALKYLSVNQTVVDMQNCLAQGYPFVFGFSVYESFESDTVTKTGVVPMPAKKEKLLGGHAVLCVGYDTPSQRFIVMNSWGTSWGMKGFFTIPMAYLTSSSLASDFWTVRLVM